MTTRTRCGSATCSSGPEATGTDTYEYNRNLVLTDGTRVDSVPNLEILTGEVSAPGTPAPAGGWRTITCST